MDVANRQDATITLKDIIVLTSDMAYFNEYNHVWRQRATKSSRYCRYFVIIDKDRKNDHHEAKPVSYDKIDILLSSNESSNRTSSHLDVFLLPSDQKKIDIVANTVNVPLSQKQFCIAQRITEIVREFDR